MQPSYSQIESATANSISRQQKLKTKRRGLGADFLYTSTYSLRSDPCVSRIALAASRKVETRLNRPFSAALGKPISGSLQSTASGPAPGVGSGASPSATPDRLTLTALFVGSCLHGQPVLYMTWLWRLDRWSAPFKIPCCLSPSRTALSTCARNRRQACSTRSTLKAAASVGRTFSKSVMNASRVPDNSPCAWQHTESAAHVGDTRAKKARRGLTRVMRARPSGITSSRARKMQARESERRRVAMSMVGAMVTMAGTRRRAG
eukprot:2163701-Rhodomonas_salina.1